MPRMIMTIGAAAAIAAANIAAPKPAEARCIGCWVGAGIAAGVIGGALASQSYGYGYRTATVMAIRRTAMPPTRTRPLTMVATMGRDVIMHVATTATECL